MAEVTTGAGAPEVGQISWFHSIDLGNGVVTPGAPPNPALEQPGAFPDVQGRTVLDIGAWDGKYSFRAEQQGATRVVALDHYVWQVDWAARERYWRQCEAEGRIPDPADQRFLSAKDVPGRRGFEYAKAAFGSRVEPVVADFMTADLEALGTFDVVLFFGVLYHVLDPFAALRRVRALTREVAAIETAAIRVVGHRRAALIGFVAGDELGRDHTNWYVPTEAGLHQLCRAAGFGRVVTRVGPPPLLRHVRSRWRHHRLDGTTELYRAVVHAYP
ncbi:MAG: methyltransferase domain-containing protein [Acidimicrobiales bacterium]|nr:methyltransferase domain-containing protein [Acidimicrobiales bacterium]MBO0887176.1 methyltransferase domain-containing protein [Acidimicrobiales bacterium]MBO0894198.1 methyltransferase domain-containing protein [Acidimicrobiales bacterium]